MKSIEKLRKLAGKGKLWRFKLALTPQETVTQDLAAVMNVAVKCNRLEIVKYLHEEKGVGLEGNWYNNSTSVIEAARRGYLDLVMYLCEKGQDIHAADADGNTAMMHAIMANEIQIFHFLNGKGADMYFRNKKGDCPFEILIKQAK